MDLKKHYLIIIAILLFGLNLTPYFSSITLAEDSPKTVTGLIGKLIYWAFQLAGILAFAMIVFAGFQFLTSGGNTAQQKDAQERIVNAIIGLILLFAFYIILYTINPDILKSSPDAVTLTPPAVTPPDQTPSKNLVNITSMGIPIDNNEFPYPAAFLDSALADKLNQLKNKKPAWHVHDACIDAECSKTSISRVDHPDDCHLDGTCVDIDSKSNDPDDNKLLIAKFNAAGLDVLDEGDHLHVALPEASGYGSYPGSDYCITEKECWYGAG